MNVSFRFAWRLIVRQRTRALLLAVACVLSACAMGDIFNGPLPYDVTEDEIVGTWEGQEDSGTFVFAVDGTLTATDLPADALPPLAATSGRWSCIGTWFITSPLSGQPEQHNIVDISLRELPGVDGGYGGSLSASKPDDVIVLSMGDYHFIKKSASRIRRPAAATMSGAVEVGASGTAGSGRPVREG